MKTSELRKWLDENCIKYHEDEKYFELINFWGVQKDKKWLIFSNEISKELAEKIVEYYNTPLKEREDAKKYRIITNYTFWKDSEYLTLILNQNKYYFSIFNTNSEEYRRIFTQNEIDNFPAEIKGAIECGFLRKVEVE